jgi:hypothetical protein
VGTDTKIGTKLNTQLSYTLPRRSDGSESGEAEAIVSKKSQDVEKDMDIFRKKIIKKFAQSGKPICNGVANQDKWAVNTKFYINNYSRLSILTPNREFKQIANPQQDEEQS